MRKLIKKLRYRKYSRYMNLPVYKKNEKRNELFIDVEVE